MKIQVKQYIYEYPKYGIGIRVWVQNNYIVKTSVFGKLAGKSEVLLNHFTKDAEFQALYDFTQETK